MKGFLFFIFANIVFLSYSQDTTSYYLNKEWKKCKKAEASYFRKLYKKNKFWFLEDYYISGQVQMIGRYKKKNLKVKDGDFTYYFDNGQISSKFHLKDNIYNGDYIKYFENGVVSQSGKYENDTKVGEWNFYFENGNLSSTIFYEFGKFNGDCYWYFKNGQMSSYENYSKGELNKVEFWNEDGSDYLEEPHVKEEATFPGGNTPLYSYLNENIVYPDKAISKRIKGKVYIKFVVDEFGEIQNVKVAKSAHPLLDKEALRVVNSMPNWIPGKMHNRPVKSSFALPINFTF